MKSELSTLEQVVSTCGVTSREQVRHYSITYWECVFVALGNQHAMRMRHIVILSSVAFPAIQYVPTLSHKRHELWGGGEESYWTQNVCFDFSYNFCVKHFSFRKQLSKIWSNVSSLQRRQRVRRRRTRVTRVQELHISSYEQRLT